MWKECFVRFAAGGLERGAGGSVRGVLEEGAEVLAIGGAVVRDRRDICRQCTTSLIHWLIYCLILCEFGLLLLLFRVFYMVNVAKDI